MAYLDALFQLGMDLTRSSTAQKEDPCETARSACSEVSETTSVVRERSVVPGRFQDRDRSGVAGSHLIIDMFGAHRLDDAEHIEKTLRRCADIAGAPVLHVHLDSGAPAEGISGVAVVGGGHISIHTDPATGYAALDFFLRGDAKFGATFGAGVEMVKKAFAAANAVVRESPRGLAEAAADRSAAALRATARSAKGRSRVRKAA